MKNQKLFITDLDGTILENGEFTNVIDRKTIINLQKNNHLVSIATGQSWSTAKEIAKKLEIDKNIDLIICNNGAIISKVNEYKTIKAEFIKSKDVYTILEISKNADSCFYAFRKKINNAWWNGVKNYSKNLIDCGWDGGFIKTVINDETDFNDVLQIMVFPNPDKVKQFQKDIEKYNSLWKCTKSDLEDVLFFEFNASNATKGKSVEVLANLLKVKKEDVIVFGDNENDISMFEFAGTAVAMGNANDYVKSKATHVTLTNFDSGLSKFINENFKLDEH